MTFTMHQVIDPSVIKTLAFGLLDIPYLAVNLRYLLCSVADNRRMVRSHLVWDYVLIYQTVSNAVKGLQPVIQ